MKNPRSAPSVYLLVGGIFALVGGVFLPVGISLRHVDSLFFYVFGFVGAVLFGVGLALLIIWYNRRKVEKAVVEGGNYVIGRIANISRNYSVTINGVNPYVIECVFQDPDTEITHTFRSADLMEDPSPYLDGDEIRIFINPDNLDEYCVDIPSALNRIVVHH